MKPVVREVISYILTNDDKDVTHREGEKKIIRRTLETAQVMNHGSSQILLS